MEDPKGYQPKGALAVTLLYLLMLIVGWSIMYLTLLERGMTQ